MSRLLVEDGSEQFDVTVLEAKEARCSVLFAVGSGGNPERHLPLLSYLAEHGCQVLAPHFERLVSPEVTARDLLLRARRLRLAVDSALRPGLPLSGVGHSIGATLLLALAGAQLWLRSGQVLPIEPDPRLEKLVLMTPPTGFFRAPGALHAVRAPILAWGGTNDVITPPAQIEYLKGALAARPSVDVRVAEGAGHFSFMNTPPPGTEEPLPNREAFLASLAVEIHRFITG